MRFKTFFHLINSEPPKKTEKVRKSEKANYFFNSIIGPEKKRKKLGWTTFSIVIIGPTGGNPTAFDCVLQYFTCKKNEKVDGSTFSS